MIKQITSEAILNLQTPAGGWTKESLAQFGIGWPPPSGWKHFLESKAGIKPKYSKGRYPVQLIKGMCRGCGYAVPKGRKTWCSDLCYERHEPSIVKRRTWDRDRGICQICGLDLIKAIQEWRSSEPEVFKVGYEVRMAWKRSKPKWQADHIIPFSEGGPTVIENMRVLCLKCHKRTTSEWRKSKAHRKAVQPVKSIALSAPTQLELNMKTFIHKFSDGTVIKLSFDLSKDMPYCESNLALDKQPVELLKEYRQWQHAVVLPELLKVLTVTQIENFACYGMSQLNQLTQ